MVVIVISGQPGAGSSTIARLLAKRLGLSHFSVGDYNKSHANKFFGKSIEKETEKGIAMWKLEKSKLRDFHLNSDEYARRVASKGDVVIDAKLGVRMVKGLYGFSVWLKADKKVRAERYSKKDGVTFQRSMDKLTEKETLERKNWGIIYGFDYFDQEKEADLAIDVSSKTPDEIIMAIIENLRARGLTE